MRVMTAVPEKWNQKTAVAIGKFEGMHKGHHKLIEKIVEKQRAGFTSVAFTFDISPRIYFKKGQGMLFTAQERRNIFESWGTEVLLEYPFRGLVDMEPERFVEEILIKALHVGYLAVGRDFCFGLNRRGSVELLGKYAAQGCFELEVIDKVTGGYGETSSTVIREQLAAGKLSVVNQLLYTPFFMEGVVVSGNCLGRTWGIPTANLVPEPEKLLPPNGVYFSRVHLKGRVLNGITNIGHKPSVGENYSRGAETYLYHFAEDIYGKEICVELLHFHRPEQRFESLEALVQQLRKDVELGKNYFGIR